MVERRANNYEVAGSSPARVPITTTMEEKASSFAEGTARTKALAKQRHEKEIKVYRRQLQAWMSACALLFVMLVVCASSRLPERWSTEQPPALQKLEVRMYGWYDPKRGWCNYETGDTIVVNKWKPK
jgi:hypothetical protein